MTIGTALENRKHEKFSQNLIKTGGNVIQAYLKSYPNATEATARSRAHSLLKHHAEIKNRTSEILELSGAGIKDLTKGLVRLLHGKKTVFHPKTGKEVQIEDNSALATAITTGFKIHGVMNDGMNVNIDNRQDNRQQSINMDTHTEAPALESTMAKLSAMNASILGKSSADDGEVTPPKALQGEDVTTIDVNAVASD